jgi:putative transposase
MARKPRVHFPSALYHVIARGNRRQAIFLDEKDFITYLSYLSEYKSKHSFHLYAYALMKNHAHLLMAVEETPLSKVMQILQFRYTRYFNKRYRKVGHLFQGRYKAILCDKDVYLLELVRYIHLNPVRAGVVEDPKKYLWTGHLSYMGRGKVDLLDKDLVLSQFGKSKYQALRRYRQFVLDGLPLGHQKKYYEVKDQRYLGEDEFIDQIERKKTGADSAVIFEIPLKDIAMEVVNHMAIGRDRLYSLTRDRAGAYGRAIVAYLARKLVGSLVKDIARHFQREPMTISEAIIKIESLMEKDMVLARRIEDMRNNLMKRSKKKYLITVA